MENDPILDLARRSRSDPASVVRDLEALKPFDREGLLLRVQQDYTHEPYRQYDPDVGRAIRSLVANEYVAGAEHQDWPTFFRAKDPHARRFNQMYHRAWRQADFSQPKFLADILQTVVRRKDDPAADASPSSLPLLYPAHQKLMPRRGDQLAIADHGVMIYLCGAYELTDAGRTVLAEQLRWVYEQGYDLPRAAAITDKPGGYHYYNGVMCGQQRQDEINGQAKDSKKTLYVEGHSVRIGMIPDRAPCTARHELSHVIYAQLKPSLRRKIEAAYGQAMRPGSDFGLIFNDEYYMRRFLHAGHPMLNASEFFAGAMHAYSHHREELMKNIHAPTTPKTVRAYAITTVRLLDHIRKAP